MQRKSNVKKYVAFQPLKIDKKVEFYQKSGNYTLRIVNEMYLNYIASYYKKIEKKCVSTKKIEGLLCMSCKKVQFMNKQMLQKGAIYDNILIVKRCNLW